jgi:uncharacterized membrane protein YgaE (UPF0421/DUF939 family)
MGKIMNFLNRIGLTLQILKTALAASVAWLVATNLLHSEYPYFAAVAAIITVQVTVADSVDKASQRIIGIIGGVLLSMLFGHWFEVGALSIFFIILVAMGIAKAFRMNQQIISQVAISSLLVLAFGQTKEGYAYERIIETIIGSVLAVLINALIIPRNAVPDVEQSIVRFSNLAATTLTNLTTLLDSTGAVKKTGRSEVDLLIKEAEKCEDTLELAEQSLKYNPLLTHQRVRLNQLTAYIIQLQRITIQIRGIRRGLIDVQTDTYYQQEQTIIQQLKQAMTATADCISAYGQLAVNNSEQNLKNLKLAMEAAQIEQAQCLNYLSKVTSLATIRDLGSILTDLGRIVAETGNANPVVEKPATV